MPMSSASRRASLQPYGTIRNAGLLAYTLLEITRIRCEQLMKIAVDDRSLVAIHRDLGLAGYYASTEFYPTVRAHCLAVAYAQSEVDDCCDRRSSLNSMFEDATSACDALTAALAIAAADHLHLAYLYVTSATESLDQEIDALFPVG